jgi:hypothetical protein
VPGAHGGHQGTAQHFPQQLIAGLVHVRAYVGAPSVTTVSSRTTSSPALVAPRGFPCGAALRSPLLAFDSTSITGKR